MNYKELIRLVHPDLNPNVQDAGMKISQIMTNKNNPSELMRLAISWGLIKGSSNTNNTQSNSSYYSKSYSDNLWIKFSFMFHRRQFAPGMKVRFTDSRGTHEAWFVKKLKNRVFFTDKKGIFTINSSLENLNQKFEIFKNRNDDLSYFDLNFWKEQVKSIKVKRSEASDSESYLEGFKRLNLIPNHVYNGSKRVTYRGRFYDLIRTNARCAFIIFNGEEKRILLKSIKLIKNI